jgi:hypothetical protein
MKSFIHTTHIQHLRHRRSAKRKSKITADVWDLSLFRFAEGSERIVTSEQLVQSLKRMVDVPTQLI